MALTKAVRTLQDAAGVEFFDYQLAYFKGMAPTNGATRTCLYYKTGAGKSVTALGGLALQGYDQAVVIAPPSTHEAWVALGKQLYIEVQPMSHAKFRMKTTKLSRKIPVIADEFHMFGGHRGQGWKKLDMLAQHLQASLVLASATPNYNDAERVYCIQHVLDQHSAKGGYLQFLYEHCVTVQNPFRMEPDVEGFKNFSEAKDFLAALPGVYYMPDDTVFDIVDIPYAVRVSAEFDVLNVNRRDKKFMASQIEKRHALTYQGLVAESGLLHGHVWRLLQPHVSGPNPVLLFAAHSTIAEAASRTFARMGIDHATLTGTVPKKRKDQILNAFRAGEVRVLIGTATLATGTDGLDKVCHKLIIVDDTDDDALRRQLVGRILHRGAATSTAVKDIFRLSPFVT